MFLKLLSPVQTVPVDTQKPILSLCFGLLGLPRGRGLGTLSRRRGSCLGALGPELWHSWDAEP